MTDTTALENVTDGDEGGFARVDDNPCAEILRAIKVVEEHLRKKRNRIEKIRIRHEELVDEIKELNKSLQSESVDFVPKLNAVLGELEPNGDVVELLPETPAETANGGANGAGANGADRAQEEKPAKRGSLRWLKEKERSRWES